MKVHLTLTKFFHQQFDLIHEDIIFCYPNNIYDPTLTHPIFLKTQARIESILNIINHINIIGNTNQNHSEKFLQFIKKEFLFMDEDIKKCYENNYFNTEFAHIALFNIQSHLNSAAYFFALFKDNILNVDYLIDLPQCLFKQYNFFYQDYYYAYPHDCLDPVLAHFSCSCFYSRLSVIDSLLSSSYFPHLKDENIELFIHLLKNFQQENNNLNVIVNQAYPHHFYDPTLVHQVCSNLIAQVEKKLISLKSLLNDNSSSIEDNSQPIDDYIHVKKYDFKQLL